MKALIDLVDKRLLEDNSLPSSVGQALGSLKTTLPDPLPIEVKKPEWILLQDPERIAKTFEFDSFDNMRYFIDELLLDQERMNHHSLMIIDYRTVSVETYTHSLNAVTEQDLLLAKFCDEIFEDTRYFKGKNKDV